MRMVHANATNQPTLAWFFTTSAAALFLSASPPVAADLQRHQKQRGADKLHIAVELVHQGRAHPDLRAGEDCPGITLLWAATDAIFCRYKLGDDI